MALSFADSIKANKEKEAEQEAVASTPSVATVEAVAVAMATALEPEEPSVSTFSLDTDVSAYSEDIGEIADDYKYYYDYHDENVSTIDENKQILLNTKQFNITQEENSQVIPFEMPRYYDGFDLSNARIQIHFVNSAGYEAYADPINVRYTGDKIKFLWLVRGNATAVAGKLQFEIKAVGLNSKGEKYVWISRSNDKLNVLKSLSGDGEIVVDENQWDTFLTLAMEQVAEAQVAANNAQMQAYNATEASEQAMDYANQARTVVDTAKLELEASVDTTVSDKISDALVDYYTSSEVDQMLEDVDVSDQLANYVTDEELTTEIDGILANIPDDIATQTWVNEQIDAVDVTDQLADYYTKDETYSKTEVDAALGDVIVDLSGYYTKSEVDSKTSGIAENTSSIASINQSITSINNKLENIDDSPRITYDATYGDVELDDGSTAEHMFTLWKTENGVREAQDRFQILGGGGGTGSSVTLRIAYVDGYGTPLVATASDPVIVKYDFSGEDSAGDTNLDGTASWKVGNRVVATETVATGECEFDLTEYVNVGDNKVVLTIVHSTGAIATKAWTVKVVDVRLESSFDDTKINVANQPVNFTFTPYGGVNKTVHFLLDGDEIETRTSTAAASGLSDVYVIPAQEHGAHLFEVYMTTDINGKTITSNRIVKDIIWFDENYDIPVIGASQQEFTTRQYEATNITYTVYDPSTETPSVSLRAVYVNEDGETVEEYNSNIVMSSNTATWQYKTDVIGEHTLTITCGETVKTLIATVVELGINATPITAGLVFDFNPIGYSNNDENRLWSYGDSGIAMTVSDNFDWINGGYQIDDNGDQCFCIKAGTSAEINYELFGDDAKVNGKQFKLIFKTENVADTNAMFLSCASDTIGTDKVGIEMLAHEATIYAKTESLPLPYAEEEIIEFEFNITSSAETPSMVMGYEDGVSTRPLVYDATHDFQQHKDHRKFISLGSADCDLYIYRFKVYNNSLSDRDILNNFIADARNAEEMINRYDRNQIYQNGILTPEYLAEVCPQLRIIKIECPRFTNDKDDKVRDTIIECIYKDGDPILDNWVAYDCVFSGQGTSSNNYGAAGRNLDLIMKPYKDYGNEPYIILGDGSRVDKISLTRDSVPVNYLNLKVNIASSENANNALLAKRYNEYNPYTRPFVRDDANEIVKIKSTMEFQNAVVFIKETGDGEHTEFADSNWHYYALGNVGDSKKTDKTRLTDPTDKYECILEVMDNTLPNSTMPTGVVDENGAPVYPIDPSEWTVGNTAYDALYAETFDEAKATDKASGLADTYGWRYIYEDGTSEENAEAKAYVENKWREFYGFVVTSTDEEFKAHLGDYCVLDSVMYYYLFTLRYTMIDNHSKNSFWHYGKTGEVDTDGNPIRKFDLCFGYDFDSALGIDNYGRMSFRYGYEEIDYVDGTSDWVWNAPQHVFFLRLRELFDAELCDLYTRLESLGCWSATSLINQFNDWQAQFPEELWRTDIMRKYIRTYTTSFINGAAKPEFLKERANGRKKTQRAQFEKNQEKYMSSKFGGTVASADDIILRCSVPNTTLAVPANFDMHLTPYSYIYLNVKYNTSPPERIRAVPNVEYTINYDSDLADIIEIYSASCLKSIGDLSACYLINGDFSNASKIRELILGSDVEGYNNSNEMTLGLGSNDLLNKLDIRNMSGLTHSLDMSGLKNLEELYASGSNVSGVIFSDGGNITSVDIPAVGSLQMKNLNYLTDENFEIVSFSNLSRLVAENSLLDLITLINNAPNLYQVRLTGIDWSLNDATLLERLYNMAGVTNTGGNSDRSILSGTVRVPLIKQQQLYNYQEAWSDLDIIATTIIEQFPVTFVNDDGSVLEIQYVDKGENAVDPVTRVDNPILTPTKESSVSTDYTFVGWDSALTSIFEPRTIKAVYSESTRSYTIRYVSKGTVLQESTGLYGENIIYEGNIPTYTLEEEGYKYYLFNRWDKSGVIDGDKTVNAVFDEFSFTGQSVFDGKQLADMTPVEIYAITKLGVENSGADIQDGDDFSFTMGYDVDFDDIESQVIISEKTVFDGTNHIDTGIQLFGVDRDFTLAIDYKMLSDSPANSVLAQCFQSNGSNGFKLYNSNGVKVAWGSTSQACASTNAREMIVIRHKKGENFITVYNSNLSGDALQTVKLDRTKETVIDSTLVLGCCKQDDGSYENHAVGEIHWCKLWQMDLGESACEQLVGWTHEDIILEVCGFKKYYLGDNPSKRCTFSLLATHLLDRLKQFNTTNTNVGGWANSRLNTFLNTRMYNAMPTQIKSLLKKVTVSSSIGNKSTEISSSDCYITVPAIVELCYGMSSGQSNFSNEPYINEGSAISYMISNDVRLRSQVDGDYRSYWTRSPNTYNASYVWQIDGSGEPYGFTTSNTSAGVLVELSF